jgi:hypothetical protein
MIYQLRGTCASGKSTVVRQFLETYGAERREIVVEPDHPFSHPRAKGKEGNRPKTWIGYELPGELVVLGKYEKANVGFEGNNQDWSRDVVAACARAYRHVVFEGYYMSQASNVWLPILEALNEEGARALPFVVKTMNTPFEVCMDRVVARTPERQLTKPTNMDVQRQHYEQLHGRVMKKLKGWADNRGLLRAEWVDYESAYDDLVRELRSDGWAG